MVDWEPESAPVTLVLPRTRIALISTLPIAVGILALSWIEAEGWDGTIIGTAFALLIAGLGWVAHYALARTRLTFAGWNINFRPGLGREVRFDCRDVIAIRRRRNRGGIYYRLTLRPGTVTTSSGVRRRNTVAIPLSGYRDPRPFELLTRLAAVAGVKADRRTARDLDERRHGTRL